MNKREWKSSPFCELCQKKLVGMVEISTSLESDGTMSIKVTESRIIDWLFCRLCQSIVCLESCFDSRSGLCLPCAQEYSINKCSDLTIWETAAERQKTDEILSSEIIF